MPSAYDFPPDNEDAIRSGDGTKLHYVEWSSNATLPLRGAVLIAHGYAERSMRYSRWARGLSDAGYRTASFDFRGMGSSEGKRGFVRDFSEYVDDLEHALLRLQRSLSVETPCFLYGHSMGGLVVLLHLSQNRNSQLKGAIISGPLLGVSMLVPSWKTALGKLLIRVAPGFNLPLDLDQSSLTHDPEDLLLLKSDSLALSHVTPSWYFASLRAMEQAKHGVPEILAPTLWLLAGEERIVSAAAIKNAYEGLQGFGDHTLIEYWGSFHELHNELTSSRDKTLEDVLKWMNEKTLTQVET